MTVQASQALLLHRGRLLRIDSNAGGWVACQRGSVWITQANDPADRILTAGERMALTPAALTLVNALAGDAVVELGPGTGYFVGSPATRSERSRARPGPIDRLAEEIERLTIPIDPVALRKLPPGARRELLDREIRRMRAQVLSVIARNAAAAVGRTIDRGVSLSRALARIVWSRARRAIAPRLRAQPRQPAASTGCSSPRAAA